MHPNVIGGGFSLDGDDTHLEFGHAIQKDLAESGISMAIFFVEYTLVPHGTFPTQMQEGVEALQFVLDSGRKPSEIILGGDSAGGNVSLAVLSHLTHPSADARKIEINQPLKALVVIAPWISFNNDWPSAQRSRYKDIVTTEAATRWSSDYLGRRESDNYSEAASAPASWWKGAKVENMIVTAGADELMADMIAHWVEKYKVSDTTSGLTRRTPSMASRFVFRVSRFVFRHFPAAEYQSMCADTLRVVGQS